MFISKVCIEQRERHSKPMYCMMNGFKGPRMLTAVNITQRYISITLQRLENVRVSHSCKGLAVTFWFKVFQKKCFIFTTDTKERVKYDDPNKRDVLRTPKVTRYLRKNTSNKTLAPLLGQKYNAGREQVTFHAACTQRIRPSCVIVYLHLNYWRLVPFGRQDQTKPTHPSLE